MNFLQLLQKCPEFTCGVHRDLTGSAGILTNNKTQIGAVEIANDAGNLTNFCHGHGNHGLYDKSRSKIEIVRRIAQELPVPPNAAYFPVSYTH